MRSRTAGCILCLAGIVVIVASVLSLMLASQQTAIDEEPLWDSPAPTPSPWQRGAPDANKSLVRTPSRNRTSGGTGTGGRQAVDIEDPSKPRKPESVWERMRRTLGDLLSDANERETVVIGPPVDDAMVEWASVNWTHTFPGGSAEAFAAMQKALYNLSLAETEALSRDVSIWDTVYTGDYHGNTKELLRRFTFQGETYFAKVSGGNAPMRALHMVDGMMAAIIECGFHKIVPHHWVTMVEGQTAVMSEYKFGVTLDTMRMAKKPTPQVRMANIRALLAAVPPWQVRLIALFDVLFGYTDRHAGNIQVTPDFNLVAIDSFQGALEERTPFVDSVVVPIAETFAIHRIGWFTFFTNSPPPTLPDDPTVLFDYRCSTANGHIGFDFPPLMEKCMRRFSDASAAEMRASFNLPAHSLRWLSEQSRRLLALGFEETCRTVAVEQIRKRGGSNWKVGKRNLYYSFEPCCAIVRDKCKTHVPDPLELNSTNPGLL